MSPDTLSVDLVFPGVGRIHRRSGTTKPAVLEKIKRALRELYADGRLDVLRAVRSGHITPMQAYDAVRRRAVADLPIGDTMPFLESAMALWIKGARAAGEYSTDHLENLETAMRRFATVDKEARVADLPRVLDALRITYGAKHPRSFNLARDAARAFVRATLKRSHPLYQAVVAIEPRKIPAAKKRALPPVMTIAQMRERFPHPESDKIDAGAWSMVVTGMGQKEYWGRWHVADDHVHIQGTKRRGRVRDVPLIMAPTLPPLSRDRWQRLFRARMQEQGLALTPYDLRRTYAKWLAEAQILRARRKLYMGHSKGDVTDLYEAHEVREFLAADGKKLREYLELPEPAKRALKLA